MTTFRLHFNRCYEASTATRETLQREYDALMAWAYPTKTTTIPHGFYTDRRHAVTANDFREWGVPGHATIIEP